MGFLFGKKTSHSENPLYSMRVQSSAQGLPIPIIYGATRVPGNLIWYGDFTAIPHTEEVGGKGGGGQSNTTYTYTAAIAIALAEGPIDGIGQVWKNKEVTTTGNLSLTTFDGTYPQSAWSYLTTNHANEALGYLGTAYVAASALDLGSDGSTPQLTFEVRGFGYTAVCQEDVTCRYVIEDVLSADHYGAGFPSANVDDLSDFETYCQAARWLVSPGYTTQRKASEMIQELADIGNAGIVWSAGKLKIIPYADEEITGVVRVANESSTCVGSDPSPITVMLGPDVGDLPNQWEITGSITANLGVPVGFSNPDAAAFDLVGNRGVSEGCRYAEMLIVYENSSAAHDWGWFGIVESFVNGIPVNANSWAIDNSGFAARSFVQDGSLGGTWNDGIVIMIALDAEAGKVWFGNNGTWLQYASSPSNPSTGVGPHFSDVSGTVSLFVRSSADIPHTSVELRTAAADFDYPIPSGFSAWDCTTFNVSSSHVCDPTGNSVTYTPDLTVQYDLTYDDFLGEPGSDPIKVRRKRQADAYNSMKIECLDRTSNYNPAVVEAKDQWNIDLYGLRPKDEVLSLHAICDVDIARSVAQTMLQRQLYQRNTYEFKLGWRYARLEPMDIVSLTDPKLGLDATPVRITSIEESADGDLSMEAEDLLIGVGTAAVVSTQASSGYSTASDAGALPGNTINPLIVQPPIEINGSPQIWIGAYGGENWGGAQIWASADNATFQQVGTLTGPARSGILAADFASGSDPDTVNLLTVDVTKTHAVLNEATAAGADAQATLCWIGPKDTQEFICYSAATLFGTDFYALDTYIRRGQDGTAAAAHLQGSDFMRIDDAVAKIDISTSLYGKTIYIKFLSFNKTGGQLQLLQNVPTYTFEVTQPAAAQTAPSGTTAGTSSGVPATLQVTLDEGVAFLTRIGSSYFGVSVEGLQTDSKVIYKQAANTGIVQATSFPVGEVATGWASDANSVWVSTFNVGTNVVKSSVFRLTASSNLASAAATYTSNVSAGQGVVRDIALESTTLWTAQTGNGQLIALNASNLAATANYSLSALANASQASMALGNGVLFISATAGNGVADRLIAWNTSNHSVTWNVPTTYSAEDVIVSGNLVFVSGHELTGSAGNVVCHNISTGNLVNAQPLLASGAFYSDRMAMFGNSQVVVVDGNRPALIDALTGNLASYVAVPATFLAGTDGSVIFVDNSPIDYYTEYLAYGYGTVGVTNVGLNLPTSVFNVTTSNVSTTGNLTATFVTQNANTFFAGPTSGNAALPTFRAIVAADIGVNVVNANAVVPGSANQVLTTSNGVAVWANAPASNFTLASLGNQNASTVLAGPASGNANTSAFRALVGGDMPKLTINTQTANYTLALADANVAYLRMNSSNATVVTVPSNANVSFANGSNFLINRAGSGNVTISAQANVTVNNSSSNTIRAQKSTVALVYVGADVWDLFGDTT